jgi:hypothetical protein
MGVVLAAQQFQILMSRKRLDRNISWVRLSLMFDFDIHDPSELKR